MGGEHRVEVSPSGLVITVRADESLLAAATRADVSWPTVCRGLGMCTSCTMFVPVGHRDAFAPMGSVELDGLRRVRWLRGDVAGERLACQVRVLRDAMVSQPQVRRGTR